MPTITIRDAYGCPTVNLPPIVRGDSYSREFGLYEDDGTTPLDVTGRTYASKIALTPGGTVVTTPTCTVTSAATGKVTLSMTTTQTALLTNVSYWGDFVENAGTSSERTLFRFRFPMIDGVT